MVWDHGAETAWHARRPYLFHFRAEDGAGKPATDMELNLGMLGHCALVRSCRSAQVHPGGSAPMAALALTQPQHAGHMTKPGDYRNYQQLKRGGAIATGVFDAKVEN